ncbi:hypothetical protein [Bacillus inaquosorum]
MGELTKAAKYMEKSIFQFKKSNFNNLTQAYHNLALIIFFNINKNRQWIVSEKAYASHVNSTMAYLKSCLKDYRRCLSKKEKRPFN